MFVYQGFDLKGSTFRLIRLQKGSGIEIKCELIHTTLDDNVIPYEAVSYTWGTMMRTNSVYVKGNRLPITSNLWRLLHDLRNLDTDRYLWVDAICINQDDDLERGHQVHRMKHIYRGAERVLFYLSPQADIADVAMSSLAELQKNVAGTRWASDDERWDAIWREVQTRLRCQYHDLELRQRQGLEYLLQCSFFRRVWILQEVASARRATVFCGVNSISANVFAVSLRLMGVSPNTHSQAVIDLMLGSLNGTTKLLQGENLASLLERFRGSEASDERDRIYALLGLCDVTSNIGTLTPDYTIPISEVIKNTLVHIHGLEFAELEPVATTVDQLLTSLKMPVHEVLPRLLRDGVQAVTRQSSGAVYSYFSTSRPDLPISISDDYAEGVLRCLVYSPAYSLEVLRSYLRRFGRPLNIASDVVFSVMKNWPDALTTTLRLLFQHASLLEFEVHVFGHVGSQFIEALKILLEQRHAPVSICVFITELWHILLRVPDDWVKPIVPLLIGEDPDTRTAVWGLRVALSKSTAVWDLKSKSSGTFGRKTAIMVLLSLGHDIRAKYNYNGTFRRKDEPVTPFEIAVRYGRLEELTSCMENVEVGD